MSRIFNSHGYQVHISSLSKITELSNVRTTYSTFIIDAIKDVFAIFFQPSHWPVANFPVTLDFISLSMFLDKLSNTAPERSFRLGTRAPGTQRETHQAWQTRGTRGAQDRGAGGRLQDPQRLPLPGAVARAGSRVRRVAHGH